MKNIRIVDANVILRYLLADSEPLFEETEKIFNEALDFVDCILCAMSQNY